MRCIANNSFHKDIQPEFDKVIGLMRHASGKGLKELIEVYSGLLLG